MTARILDGRPVADAMRAESAERVARLVAATGRAPRLAIVRFDEEGPSAVYARSVTRAAERVGIQPMLVAPSAGQDEAEVAARIRSLNQDLDVAGIVVAQPIPIGLASPTIIEAIDPSKDVDGATTIAAGRLARGQPTFAPATALAVMTLLRAYGIPVAGRRVVVVGRSMVVGRPVAALLVAANATVTVCHRATRDLADETRRAEVLVVAAGAVGLITGEMLSSASTVIDCGINTVEGGVIGDVASSAAQVAAALSPVPGGVGPVTAMSLIGQVVESAERRAGIGAIQRGSRLSSTS